MSTRIPNSLIWLGDAPMFIDAPQVAAFYDAVIRPEAEQDSVVVSESVSTGSRFSTGLSLSTVFPWLLPLSGGATASAERTKAKSEGQSVTLRSVNNAHRQLQHLALFYLGRELDNAEHADRIRFLTVAIADGKQCVSSEPKTVPAWNSTDFIQALPRALVFVDFPPGTRFIPAALETAEGRVKLVYERFGKAVAEPGGYIPPSPKSGPDYDAKSMEYWTWFHDHYDDTRALIAVEQELINEHIAWIDYRVRMADGENFLHLHLNPRGLYDTGHSPISS